MSSYSLHRVTDCAGCAAKLAPGELAALLGGLHAQKDPNLLVGFDTSDDAAIYKLCDDIALVSTLDFFPPVVDDPYSFGAIAAANALSDIYAMGATPKICLNIMAVPEDMPKEVVAEILRGGFEKVQEAGASLAGGHSIYDAEPKYGLAVQGIVNPHDILKNSSAKTHDKLIITKALGTAPIVTADKAGYATPSDMEAACKSMMCLNRWAKEISDRVCLTVPHAVHGLTDVTGFGLLGHLIELCEGSNLAARIHTDALPFLHGAEDAAKIGLLPAGMYRNRRHSEDKVHFADDIELWEKDLMFCPETSGGLLFAVAEDIATDLVAALRADPHCVCASIIGELYEPQQETLPIEVVR